MKIFLIIFIFQLLFVYLRTINMVQIQNDKVLASVISGTFFSLLFIINIALGVNAVNKLHIPNIIAYVTGGVAGQVVGMRLNKIKSFISKTIFSTKNHE